MKLTPKERQEITSATIAQSLWLMLICSGLFVLTTPAAPPTWWSSRSAMLSPVVTTNSGVVTTNYVRDDYGIATQGQLKLFTARAVDELNADLTNNGGAGPALSNLVYGWVQDYVTNGYNATNIKPSDYNAMTVGQLKYVGGLVYGQLATAGYTGLTPSWLHQNTNTDNAVANLGQLKQLFDFDLSIAPAAITNLVATSSAPGEIDLTWTEPAINNATSQVLQQSTDGGTTWTTIATLDPGQTSYNGSGLVYNNNYSYQLSRSNNAGSTTSTATTPLSPAANPRFAVIDLGTNNTPLKVTDSGYVLLHSFNPDTGAATNTCFVNGTNMALPPYASGDLAETKDITEDGTIVGRETSLVNDGTNSEYVAVGIETWTLSTNSFTPSVPDLTYGGWQISGVFTTGGAAHTGLLVGHTYGSEPEADFLDTSYDPYKYALYYSLYGGNFIDGAHDIWSTALTWVDDGIAYYDAGKNGTELGHNVLPASNHTNQGLFWPQGVQVQVLGVNTAGTAILAEYNSSLMSMNGSILNWAPTSFVLDDGTTNQTTLPAGFNPKSLNNAGVVMGANNAGQSVWWDKMNGVHTNVFSGGHAAQMNAMTNMVNGTNYLSYQAIGGNISESMLWEMNPTTNLAGATFKPPVALDNSVPTNSGWSGIGASYINNNGAIVGTATHTSTGTGDPIAAGSHGVMLCPVAVVQDSGNDHVIDMTDQSLSYVRFGLWDSAFSTINPPSPLHSSLSTPTVNNDNAEATNFVGNDSRRFYIRVYDPSANHSVTTADTVTVDWYTQTSAGADDDHPATDTITLTETGVNTGVFVSKALMLVADEVDNGQPTNTGLSGGGNANEGQADHRLRRAALGDKMCYCYTPAVTGSTKQTFSIPIFNPSSNTTQPDIIKNITVHFIATTGSGINHSEISSDISSMETQMSARFAVAGIKPNYIYDATSDVLDVTSTGIALNDVGVASLGSGGNEYVIIQALRSKYGSFNISDPTIYVIIVGKFHNEAIGGESITDGVVAASPSKAIAQRCSFMAQIGGINSPMAAPHEIGHQLSDETTGDLGTDNNHYDGLNLGQNLMYYKADDGSQVTDAKRLWDDPAHADTVHNYQIDYMRSSPLCR